MYFKLWETDLNNPTSVHYKYLVGSLYSWKPTKCWPYHKKQLKEALETQIENILPMSYHNDSFLSTSFIF